MFFDRASFSGGRVFFDRASFSGGKVSFLRASFSGGLVSFDRAAFSDGEVSFREASFSGERRCLNHASFSGGAVSFTTASGPAPYGLLGAVGTPAPATVTLSSLGCTQFRKAGEAESVAYASALALGCSNRPPSENLWSVMSLQHGRVWCSGQRSRHGGLGRAGA
ncbi:hypothetical protein ACG2OD_01595 [Streptomyces sp. PDY-4]|uniref:hypothetical protein n=1 Tax=Streptomyces sp. PDY-4 TaxID=3376070 RepID=UPI0037A2946E